MDKQGENYKDSLHAVISSVWYIGDKFSIERLWTSPIKRR
jgi:hypothetical protein